MIQKKTPRNKAHLVRRLVKLEYRDSQNMIEHLNNFKGLVNKLTKAEMTIDDELQALLLLSSLPESWDTFVVTLSNSSPNGKLSMDIEKEKEKTTTAVATKEDVFLIDCAGSFGTVKMGNEDMCQIVGCGDIFLSSNVGCQLILKDVRHILDMRLNLISVGKLYDDGFESRMVMANGNSLRVIWLWLEEEKKDHYT
ncbi:Retrovirus-related Pol polyprotein from transposon TNT 1-94 [Sesamum alatum]|uniref:Retrovirus-related Pol polyprotein from transposon TNT 1-94 n=1 Tax=Sesamum alatum TaxID=300844 RepID=A0AAE2CXK7_9LAMI|nr:Retrovirus-related Pol polyprotein from transposon TNT 1-94 [Sesamum alatum]